jgi:hypothetical protein
MKQKSSHKLGIIVPYRNRYRQLIHFKKAIKEYFSTKDIEYKVIVVEQDDAKAFNRGKLLNIGAIRAKDLGCDYVVFHDVDMIPVNVDYSYSDTPVHLASNFVYGYEDQESSGVHFEGYFGGVTMFPLSLFEDINGYSNDYWGWGFEDDDLFHRVKTVGLPTDFREEINYVSSTAGLRFNGTSSYISCNNEIDFRKSFSIHVSFNPIELMLDHERENDRYTIFSVPGYDFNFYYDSFKHYNIEIFDRRGNIHTIASEIKEPKATKATIVYSSKNKTLKLFLDGELIGKVDMEERLFDYSKYKTIYIGCSNREEDAYHQVNYFKGIIDTFAVYSKVLTAVEVKSIVENTYLGLGTNFGDYESCEDLTLYYDPKSIRHYKLIDLSGNDNHGNIVDCWFEPVEFITHKNVPIPFRRQCIFRLLDHKPGGYLDGKWRDQLTRFNQLKFTNETLIGIRNYKSDGLNDCEFKVLNEVDSLNFLQLTVKI